MVRNNAWNFDTTYSVGDILYASSSSTLSKLPIGTINQVLTVDTGLPAWQNATFNNSNSQTILFWDDLQGITPSSVIFGGGGQNGSSKFSGNASDILYSPNSGHPGNMNLATTSTSVTGAGEMYTGFINFLFGGGSYDYSFWSQTPVLSSAAQRYIVRCGFTDGINGSIANGVWFEYSDNVNAGNWQLKTSKSSIVTTVNTTSAATVNWTKYTISINASATSAIFKINDIQVGTTITTNIPNTSAVGLYWSILKTVGSTARSLNLDFYQMLIQLTNPRF